MNIAVLKDELLQALGDGAGNVFSDDALQVSILRSVRAYSQYRPVLRRMGTAQLVTSIKAGAETITVAGGLLTEGSVITLDVGSPFAEIVTIAAIVQSEDESEPEGYLTMTLTAATVKAHRAGALIAPQSADTTGLSLVPGQDSYPLPSDFIKPEQSSFDMAVGAKLSYRKENGFYDASSQISNQLSGTGFGRAAGYGPSSTSGYPVIGNPFNNPNSGIAQPCQSGYRFYLSNYPYLRVIPVPTTSQVLDFDYFGSHTIASVPEADTEIITLYAVWAAATAEAKAINRKNGGDVKIEEFEQRVSKNVEQLLKIAQDAFTQWENKLRFVPYGTSG